MWKLFLKNIRYNIDTMMRRERLNQKNNPIVGCNIKRLRIEQNLRNVDITSMLQLKGIRLGTSTLSKIERGTTNPPIELLIALTDILQCDYNAFFYIEEEELEESKESEEGKEQGEDKKGI